LQLMPGASEDTIRILEERAANLQTGISSVAEKYEDMAEFVGQLIGNHPFAVHEQTKVRFHCSCSKNKMSDTLIGLGENEMAALMSQGGAEVLCHFCNESYRFDLDDLKTLQEHAAKGE